MPSRSALIGRLSRGDRIVVLASALVVAIAAIDVARPRRWEYRERWIEQRRTQLAGLRDVVSSAPALRTASPQSAYPAGRRPIGGATPVEAASELRTILQSYADESRLTVTALELLSTTESADVSGVMPMIPGILSAVGDMRGIAAFLHALESRPPVVLVTQLAITRAPGDNEGRLNLALALRAPWVAQMASGGAP